MGTPDDRPDDRPDASGISLNFGAKASHRPRARPHANGVAGHFEAEDKAQPANGARREQQLVVPGLANTFTVGGAVQDAAQGGPRGFNPNRYLPQQNEGEAAGLQEDNFELAAVEAQEVVEYGLQVRKRDAPVAPVGEDAPKRRRVVAEKGWEAAAFKEGVAELPEEDALDAYEAMPVEFFGEAMLRGMGWVEESGVLPNGKKAPEASEYIKRPERLGLGASEAPKLEKEKRFIRPGESREPKKQMVLLDEAGHTRHRKTLDEQLVERVAPGPAVGKIMRILKGRDAGLLCRVVAFQPQAEGRSQHVTVRLLPSEESASVRVKDLGERDEAPPAAEEGQEKRAHKERRRKPDAGGDGEPESHAAKAIKAQNGHGGQERARGQEKGWLYPHIRVKIIDKRLQGGRLYLKKGEVVDVLEPTVGSIFLDSGESLEAAQSQLETLVPKQDGARVLLLGGFSAEGGTLQGKVGRLLSRNSETARAAVQLLESLEVVRVSFDDLSEYVGEAKEEE